MEDVAFVDRLKVVPALINARLSPNTNNRLSVTPSLKNHPRTLDCGRDVMCFVCHRCRFCSRRPASSSWWMFVRSAVSSCRLSFIPPTVWASEPSQICIHARSFSAKLTPSPVRFSMFTPQIVSLHHQCVCVCVSTLVGDGKNRKINFKCSVFFVSLSRAAFH